MLSEYSAAQSRRYSFNFAQCLSRTVACVGLHTLLKALVAGWGYAAFNCVCKCGGVQSCAVC